MKHCHIIWYVFCDRTFVLVEFLVEFFHILLLHFMITHHIKKHTEVAISSYILPQICDSIYSGTQMKYYRSVFINQTPKSSEHIPNRK